MGNYDTVERLKKLDEKIEQLKKKKSMITQAESKAERKTRTRALVIMGGLVKANWNDLAKVIEKMIPQITKPADLEILKKAFPTPEKPKQKDLNLEK